MELIDAIPQDVSEATARRVEGQKGWIAAASVVSALLALLQLVVAARKLGPADFGILAIVVAVPSVLRSLLTLRTRAPVQKYLNDALVDRDFEYAGAILKGGALLEILTSAIALGVAVVAAPHAARLFTDDPVYTKLFIIYAAIIPCGMLMQTSLGVLQYFGRFDIEMLMRAAERVAGLSATLGAVMVGGTLDAFVTAAAIGPCVGGILCAVLAIAEVKKRLGARALAAPLSAMSGRWWRLTRASLGANFGHMFVLIASRDGDPLWIAWITTPMTAGYYALASSLASVLLVPTAPFVHSVYPDVARLASQQRWKDVRAFTIRSAAMVGGYAALMLLIFAVTGNDLVPEMFGRAYEPARYSLLVLLAAFGISATAVWARPVLLAAGLAPATLLSGIVGAGIKFAGVWYMLPRWGLMGCSVSTAAAMSIAAFLLAVRARAAARLRPGP